MESTIAIYLELVELFEENNHFLYLVGGTVRDYLLNLPLTDMDAVTDATPEEMMKFLIDADDTFKKFGSIKLKFKGKKFDITTLRKETGYLDSRHPNEIVFTDKLEEDVVRRDISINAMYLDKNLKVIDMVDGEQDIQNKLIRLIGDKELRVVEDPLRILRILRFSLDLGFDIEEDTYFVVKRNILLLNKLNIDKVKQEINKCKHKQEMLNLLKLMNIQLEL